MTYDRERVMRGLNHLRRSAARQEQSEAMAYDRERTMRDLNHLRNSAAEQKAREEKQMLSMFAAHLKVMGTPEGHELARTVLNGEPITDDHRDTLDALKNIAEQLEKPGQVDYNREHVMRGWKHLRESAKKNAKQEDS